jgi:hypothetical protein
MMLKSFKYSNELYFVLVVLIMSACTPIKTTIKSVNVEETVLNDAGVVLDDIEAVTYTTPVDENVYSTRVVSYSEEFLVQSRSVAYAQPVEVLQKPAQYFVVSNKSLLDSLKVKLGVSFYKNQDTYQSAITNQKPLDNFPELGVEYKFKAKVNSTLTEDISFKLSDVYAGFGVLIQVRGESVSDYSGIGKVLFESPTLSVFKIGSSSLFAVNLESGGKLYGISLSTKKFKLSPLAVSLPTVARTVKVVGQRVSPGLVSKLGTSVVLNGTLFYYVDSKSMVSHIYFMNSNFVMKDIVSQCATISGAGLLPAGISCLKSEVLDPAVLDPMPVDAVRFNQLKVSE